MLGLESPRPLSEWGWGPTAQVSSTTAAVVPTPLSDGAAEPVQPGDVSFPGLAHRWPGWWRKAGGGISC